MGGWGGGAMTKEGDDDQSEGRGCGEGDDDRTVVHDRALR